MFYFLFWLSAALLFLGTVGYPMLLWVWVKLRNRSVHKRTGELPRVSLVLPCFNEEQAIGRKINNLLQLSYPPDKLEIIVVSDGSTDRTELILELFLPHPQLLLIPLPERQGKPHALNAGVAAATGDILVFSDTRQLFNPDCLEELVKNFSDKQVGGVSGTLIDYTNKNQQQATKTSVPYKLTAWFRDLENQIKIWESSIHSVVGVYGALYAIRRELYQPIPEHVILDDMQVPFSVIRQGYRVVFDPDAAAMELTKAHPGIEFNRRQRIFTGSFQFLGSSKTLFNRQQNPVVVQLVLHKFLRLLIPFLLLVLFIANLFIATTDFYKYTLLLQLLFYGLCLLSLVFKKPSVFYLFSKFNLSILQGLLAYLRKSHSVKWQKQV